MNQYFEHYLQLQKSAREYRDTMILKKFGLSMKEFKKQYVNHSVKKIYANRNAEQIRCKCGSSVRKSYMERHLKSGIHARKMIAIAKQSGRSGSKTPSWEPRAQSEATLAQSARGDLREKIDSIPKFEAIEEYIEPIPNE